MARDIITGIDIGVHSIQTMVAKFDKNADRLRVLGVGLAQSDGVRKGDIVDSDACARQVKKSLYYAMKSSGVRVSNAFFSYGGSSLESFNARGSIVLPHAHGEISHRDIDRVLEASYTSVVPLHNKFVMHRIPMLYRVDKDIVTRNPEGLICSRLEVETLFITALAPHIEQIARCAEIAGISVDNVIAAPLAIARAVLSKRQKEVGVLSLDIGAGSIHAAVFEDGAPFSVSRFPVGSESITHDIAIGMRVGLEQAEEYKQSYKKNHKGSSKRELEEIISARVTDMFEAVDRYLKKIGRDRLLPAGVILSGGGAKLSEIAKIARDTLRLPVDIAQNNHLAGFEEGFDPMWAVSSGLCLLGFDEGSSKNKVFSNNSNTVGTFIWKWLRSLLP